MSTPAERFSLDGRTAIVTGASSGLGVTFARTLAEAGANVVLAARRADRLADVAAEIGPRASCVACDVTDAAACDALVAEAVARHGAVDVMVANAGAVPEGAAEPERMPSELFAQAIAVNLVGTFNTCAAAGRHMLARGRGSIVTIASIAGVGGQFNTPAGYSASKAGIVNLTQHLALRWADRGVRVNAIGPGWFPTEMTGQVLALPAWTRRIEDQTAMRRVGDPDELAGALLLLASDAGSYITGQLLMVDGGMSASIGQAPYPAELVALHAEVMPHGLGERILPSPGGDGPQPEPAALQPGA